MLTSGTQHHPRFVIGLTTITLDMQRPILPRLPTMHTLRRRPSLLLHLIQRPIIVDARGRSMALDARLTGVFLVVDEDHRGLR